jgi:hypothetical protein
MNPVYVQFRADARLASDGLLKDGIGIALRRQESDAHAQVDRLQCLCILTLEAGRRNMPMPPWDIITEKL